MNVSTQRIKQPFLSEGIHSLQFLKNAVVCMQDKESYFRSAVLPRLCSGYDYFVKDGKKFLKKAGAQKLIGLLGFIAVFERDIDNMNALGQIPGFISFVCRLKKEDGVVYAEGRGATTLEACGGDPNLAIRTCQARSLIDATTRAFYVITDQLYQTETESASTETQDGLLPAEQPKRENTITDKQRNLLTSLIYQNFHDKETRDPWLAQIDDLTKSEASDQIQSFINVYRR